jgi:hypothetical protein
MASRNGADPIGGPFKMKKKAVEVARRANYARVVHQYATRMREIADSGARILPTDAKFMHVVQELDVSRPARSHKNARL